jgi:hypothetical protein
MHYVTHACTSKQSSTCSLQSSIFWLTIKHGVCSFPGSNSSNTLRQPADTLAHLLAP